MHRKMPAKQVLSVQTVTANIYLNSVNDKNSHIAYPFDRAMCHFVGGFGSYTFAGRAWHLSLCWKSMVSWEKAILSLGIVGLI
jgi:hypothetical protein